MVELRIGQVLARRYEIRSVVGQRPLGTVLRALDREIGVEVALRIVGAGLLPDLAARQAFVQRVGKAKSLSHPNLVRLHSTFVDDELDGAVVAVQWAPGAPLAERVRLGVPRAEARALLRRIASAVAHAHQHGIFFGEVRTDTVVVLEDTLKLFTVGIGAAVPRDRYLAAVSDTSIFSRLAPEIRAGKPVEPAADVYSLGVLAAELLTGAAPGSPLSVPGVRAETVALISSALSEDPRARPTSVEAFASQLDQLLGDVVVPERKPRKTRPPREVGVDTDPNALERVHSDTTRQVEEDELRALQGSDVTRRATDEEIFPLRVQSTETSQADLAELDGGDSTDSGEDLRFGVPVKPDVTVSGRRPANEEAQLTERVMLLEADHAHTTRVPLLDDEPSRGHDDGEDEHTTQVPRVETSPEQAPDDTESSDDEDEDDNSLTERVEKLSAEELAAGDLKKTIRTTRPPPQAKAEPRAAAPVAALPRRPAVAPPPPVDPPSTPKQAHPPQAPSPPPEAVQSRQTPPSIPITPPMTSAPRPQAQIYPSPDVPRATSQTEQPDEELPQLLVIRAPAAEPAPTLSPFATVAPPPKRRSGILVPLIIGLSLLVAAGAAAAVYWLVILPKSVVAELPIRPANPSVPNPVAIPANPPNPVATTPAPAAHPIVTHPDLPSPAPRPDPPPASPPAIASSACPAGMVELRPHLCIDAYESPGTGLPRAGVSFADASQACTSRGGRLCSDLEWEHACRGHGGASYPYGNSYDPKRCNTASSELKTVGSFPACRSASGAFDMSGNLAEWVTAKGEPANKGGSSWDGNPMGRCSTTQKTVAPGPAPHVGFRCCQAIK